MFSKLETADLPWWCIALVALPIAAFFTCEALLALAQKPDLPASAELRDSWSEAAARMQLLGMIPVYFAAAIAVIVKFGADIVFHFRDPARLRLMVAYGLCLAAGLLVLALVYGVEVLPKTKALLNEQVFENALKQAAVFGPSAWGSCAFDVLLGLVNGITLLAIPALIAGAISCLATFTLMPEVESWRRQVERLKTYLYTSTGFLVLGVLYFKTWTGYPSYYLENQTAGPAFRNLANTFTMYTGIEYSVVLAAYALPVAWILSRDGEKIAKDIARQQSSASAVTPLTVSQIRKEEELVFSTKESLQAILAVLAPFIVGTLPSLTAAFD
jgi:hypothetical protein